MHVPWEFLLSSTMDVWGTTIFVSAKYENSSCSLKIFKKDCDMPDAPVACFSCPRNFTIAKRLIKETAINVRKKTVFSRLTFTLLSLERQSFTAICRYI